MDRPLVCSTFPESFVSVKDLRSTVFVASRPGIRQTARSMERNAGRTRVCPLPDSRTLHAERFQSDSTTSHEHPLRIFQLRAGGAAISKVNDGARLQAGLRETQV